MSRAVCQIGRATAAGFRAGLWLLQEDYPELSWREQKGWVRNTFYLEGSDEVLSKIAAVIEAYKAGRDDVY